ncbi:MAG: TetR/AcrR family transcriptional regulator [Acidimicrobiales bacterium]|jgi:TetR/AcrR family transcriptional repressor of nem operon
MSPGGRPRSFDDDEVVERARDLFWRRGYEATSMRELGEGLGVLPGSLHAAFGSKHELFARALRSYADLSSRSVKAILEGGSVLPQLRRLLTDVLAAAVSTPGRGCMLGNSAAELIPDDVEAGAIVRGAFHDLEATISHALERGKESGEIRSGIDCDAQALLLVALMQGLHVLARTEEDPLRLEEAIDASLVPLSR